MKVNEVIRNFVEEFGEKEEYIIYFSNGSTKIAVIKEIGDDYIRVSEKDSDSILMLNHIACIREYPKDKNGKKKGIFI